MTVPLVFGFVGALVLAGSCAPSPPPALGPQELTTSVKKEADKKEAAPVPKTNEEIEKLGIPVFLGSNLDDKKDSATLDERFYQRVYKVKLFAPADFATVGDFYQKALKDAKRNILGDNQLRIDGKSAGGDDVEVLLGPAADHKQTVVLAWLTQNK